MASATSTNAVTVYCGSSTGSEPTYIKAATSLGSALAKANRRLVYGGGEKGLMGAVSGAVIAGGGTVTGVIPHAMLAAGGEQDKVRPPDGQAVDKPGKFVSVVLEPDTEQLQTIVVPSMHERKVEMARRSCGFIGLPGGYGTFEEVLEAVTWTQLGIHDKPVVLINVLSFYDPLRDLVNSAVNAGFIQHFNKSLIIFVDGPASREEHQTFDWGTAALDALESWHQSRHGMPKGFFDWTQTQNGGSEESLSVT
ncbi:hypothetical protein E1B28_002492 [Marasmius oreades]|uniref:Cytokinin riboside 5'-monophosphate phosphoribohydrolase n=1 Tax=Marasmius oreades TaxID=181124 RepID=A0A9P7RNR8_9AGAR|nr:uncharacterized protein E1B28_002492 [Marasmius oreades]KAG7086541.1 hypothetical protein E1B28_002492 [Marasmius oreades]